MKQVFSIIITLLLYIQTFAQDTNIESIEIQRLPDKVNSSRNETHPLAFSEEMVFFTSEREKQTKVYSIKKTIEDNWRMPITAPIIQNELNRDYLGGTFSPDKKRFYCTICEKTKKKYTNCAIYVSRHLGHTWSKPMRLPENINRRGTTNQDPFIVMEGDTEILYFSSNRDGSYGGKDIWFAKRDARRETVSFYNITNLGSEVNTAADEIAPHYKKSTETLYFSSKGHEKQFGGFDIYRVRGRLRYWENLTLMPRPINSLADDAYLHFYEDNSDGYVASNRFTEHRGFRRTDYDLYTFNINYKNIVIGGRIFDNENPKKILRNVNINLYEIEGFDEFLTSTAMTSDGNYMLFLQPNRTFTIELKLDGYETANFNVTTKDFTMSDAIERNFPMIPLEDSLKKNIIPKPINPDKNKKIEVFKDDIILKGNLFNALLPEQSVENVTFVVNEIATDGKLIYHSAELFSKEYNIRVLPNKRYRIKMMHSQYQTMFFLVETSDKLQNTAIEKDYYLFPKD